MSVARSLMEACVQRAQPMQALIVSSGTRRSLTLKDVP